MAWRLGSLAGFWYSTPRNPHCRSLILDLSMDWLLFWQLLSIFSIPSWSLQPSVRCPVLSTMVPAPSGSLPQSQSPLSVGAFHSGNVRVSCISTPDSYLLLAPVFHCWAPGFHFGLQLLGSRLQLLGSPLPLLSSAAGLLASISGFSCWALGFHFWLQLFGSWLPTSFCLPLLASAVGLLASAAGFLFWLLASVIDQDQICLLHSEFWLIYHLSSMQGMMGSQQPIRGWHLPLQRHLGNSSALWGDGGSPWIRGAPQVGIW